MKTSVPRRGNVRLRKAFIAPVPEHPRTYKLHELLLRITKKNMHRGVTTGAPLGKEIWS
jgi:antitoxin component of MazEF toxin-antitoxin module